MYIGKRERETGRDRETERQRDRERKSVRVVRASEFFDRCNCFNSERANGRGEDEDKKEDEKGE